jgi:hypothetical protein
MNCGSIRTWLLGAAPGEALPDVVRHHLDRCASCRGRWRRLGQLDEKVRRLAVPAPVQSRKEELWQLLPPRSAAPRFSAPLRRYALVACSAAALFLAIGWGLGRRSVPAPPVAAVQAVEPESPVSGPSKRLSAKVVADVARADVVLASAATAGEQVKGLSSMSETLRVECLRLAREGPREELPLVAGLYRHVVRRGLVGRARALSASERRQLLPPLIEDLRRTATQAESLSADALPVTAELLKPFTQTCREGADLLRAPAETEEEPLSWSMDRGQPLLAVFVVGGLRLVESADPLKRAQLSSDLAEHMTQAIVLCATEDDSDQAEELGVSLGALLEMGLGGNLDSAEKSKTDKKRAGEIARLRQRVSRPSGVLERNLTSASPGARRGLERALAALAHGRDRALSKGRKGWLHGGGRSHDDKGRWKGPFGKPFGPAGHDKRGGKRWPPP